MQSNLNNCFRDWPRVQFCSIGAAQRNLRRPVLELLDEANGRTRNKRIASTVGQYSFVHALIRETLYDEISTARRVRLHRRIGETLESFTRAIRTHI